MNLCAPVRATKARGSVAASVAVEFSAVAVTQRVLGAESTLGGTLAQRAPGPLPRAIGVFADRVVHPGVGAGIALHSGWSGESRSWQVFTAVALPLAQPTAFATPITIATGDGRCRQRQSFRLRFLSPAVRGMPCPGILGGLAAVPPGSGSRAACDRAFVTLAGCLASRGGNCRRMALTTREARETVYRLAYSAG
jgi:hypothetical protein